MDAVDKPKLRDGVVPKQKGPVFVLYDYDAGLIFETNEVGYRIAVLCDGDHSPNDIAIAVRAGFVGPPCRLMDDVSSFLQQMQQAGLTGG